MKLAIGDDRIDVLDCHPHVTTDGDHLDLACFIDVIEDLVDDPPNLGFKDCTLLGMRGLEPIDLFEHSKGAESVRIGKLDVPSADDEYFRAATTDLNDNRFDRCQDWVELQQRLDPHVGDPVDLCFVEDFDFESRRDVDSVDERQAVARLPHSTRCHHADLFRTGDAILLHQTAIAFEDPDALLDALPRDLLCGEGILAQRDCTRDFFERSNVALTFDFRNRHADARRADIDDRHGARSARRLISTWSLTHPG